MGDFPAKLPDKLWVKVFNQLDFISRVKTETVSKRWRNLMYETYRQETRSVWLYVIFRRGLSHGHEKVSVKISYDGPIFWSKLVAYVYCCSCHFNERHESTLMSIFNRLANGVQRLCMVDSPVNLPFLTNPFYEYVVEKFPNLQFLYLRELDLENMNATTTKKMSEKANLKKVIVHDCINYDAATEYGLLKRLMVFTGPIQGLRALLGDAEFFDA